MSTLRQHVTGAQVEQPRLPVSGLAGAAGYLHRAAAALLPALSHTESAALADRIAFVNVQRVRLIAFVLTFTQPFLIALDWIVLDAANDTLATREAWTVIAFRACLILASALILLLNTGVANAGQIRSRHHTYQYAYALICILLATVWTGLRSPISIAVYCLGIFSGAALLSFPLRKSVALYGIAWLALVLVLLRPQTLEGLLIPNVLHGTLLTALAWILSRATYLGEVRHLQNAQVIERQQRELEVANRHLAESNAILEHLSFFDSLTGVPNRRYFDDHLRREWRRALRENTILAVIMIDIDYFKQYNDTYGHQAGDECLRRVATGMSAVFNRPSDLLARYGGDEFAAILPCTEGEGANLVGERLHHAVNALRVIHTGSPRGVLTVSMGVACLVPSRTNTYDDLVAAADEAMYRAKAGGRNRSEIAV